MIAALATKSVTLVRVRLMPDQQGERGADAERCEQDERVGRGLAEHRDGVGADAVERDGGERDVAGVAGKQRPGAREHHVAHQPDHQPEAVVAEEVRGGGERGKPGEAREHAGGGCHAEARPKRPDGRQSSTAKKRP
jgi:hypothetical protein